jgi:hypothetical protein
VQRHRSSSGVKNVLQHYTGKTSRMQSMVQENAIGGGFTTYAIEDAAHWSPVMCCHVPKPSHTTVPARPLSPCTAVVERETMAIEWIRNKSPREEKEGRGKKKRKEKGKERKGKERKREKRKGKKGMNYLFF